MMSSNEGSSNDHPGVDNQTNFLPADQSTAHLNVNSSEAIVFDPSQQGFIPEENSSSMFTNGTYEGAAQSAEGEWEENDDQDSTISDLSCLSDLSNLDGHGEASGPIMWVHKQMLNGVDPRMIIEELCPRGACIPNYLSNSALWELIAVNFFSEPKRSKLTHINTLDDAVNLLKTCNKIIVLTGAGVSVSCGIPDFRSRDGIYARLKKDYPALPDPQAMFDIQYFRSDPRPFFKFAKEIYPGQFAPSPSHRFIKVLEKQNRLLRNYSQNIDTLEHAAGIKNVITCHGSFATATCTMCGHKVDSSVIKEDIFEQKIPYCPVCPDDLSDRGIMKPDIVFFGEGLSDEFHEAMATDKDECDLLIVIGSSLKVRPVARIPSTIPTNIPQILINREPLNHLTFDIELLGDCDVIIGELCRRLESEWEIDEKIPRYTLKEIVVQTTSKPNAAFSEINNNPDSTQMERANLPQSEESSSCDCRELSAIKLDDSQDGFVQEQPSSSTTHVNETIQKTNAIDDKSLWSSDNKESLSKKIPDHSFLYFSPNRYVFSGAEVYKECTFEADPSSTPTDYSSDCDDLPAPPDSSTDINYEQKEESINEVESSCQPEHCSSECDEIPNQSECDKSPNT